MKSIWFKALTWHYIKASLIQTVVCITWVTYGERATRPAGWCWWCWWVSCEAESWRCSDTSLQCSAEWLLQGNSSVKHGKIPMPCTCCWVGWPSRAYTREVLVRYQSKYHQKRTIYFRDSGIRSGGSLAIRKHWLRGNPATPGTPQEEKPEGKQQWQPPKMDPEDS